MSKDKEDMIGCAYLVIALAIAFAIVISAIKYWNLH